ncbi:MAG: pyruvate dehydrogenase (acetyl-transferring) E1 component subunit alpha, partial [Acidimicrobiia bacterium]|nr:pyruvate dehydrogenase (acetyl-transferring) E1 component subunit alpha [Acidimicrobiia bacterium]
GAAWSAQMRATDQVTAVFFGDGTTNIGAFHEAVNFAAVWDLPIVFVCENNLYMEYTPIDLVTPVPHPAADRASAYGLEKIVVDGNDADDVYDTAIKVVNRARTGGGPSLVEAVTYRHGGHSRADPGKYRPAEELEAWLDRDPIPMYHQRMLRLGIPEGDLSKISQDVARRVDEATEFAKAGALPSEDVLMTDVWADGGSSWRN